MKNKDLYAHNQVLNFVKYNNKPDAIDPLASIQNAVVLHAIGYNRRLITQELELIDASRVLPDKFNLYETELVSLQKESTNLTSDEIENKYADLKGRYPEISDEYEAHSTTFTELLNNHVSLEFKVVPFESLSKADGSCWLTKVQMDILDFMITFE